MLCAPQACLWTATSSKQTQHPFLRCPPEHGAAACLAESRLGSGCHAGFSLEHHAVVMNQVY